MKKKIMFIVNHEIVIYNFRKEIIEALLSLNHEVIIVSPGGEKVEKLVKLGAKHINITIDRHSKNIFKEIKHFLSIRKIIIENDPEFLFTFTIKPNIYGGLASRNRKIVHVPNITGLGTAFARKGFLRSIICRLYKMAFKKSHLIFVQNSHNLLYMSDLNIYKEKLTLLPGSGVNLKEYKYQEYPTNGNIRFVYIARIMKEKGIDQFLIAARKIKHLYPKTEFHICGFLESEYKGQLEEYIKNETVIYHGLIPSSQDILSQVHCLVHPSYYPEGISNVILEASATGRPVITTYEPGCFDAVRDEQTGYLFISKNDSDLVSKLTKFIELDYREKVIMGLNARSLVEESFDREIVVNKYLEVVNIYDK